VADRHSTGLDRAFRRFTENGETRYFFAFYAIPDEKPLTPFLELL
jgi:hypothetical protein